MSEPRTQRTIPFFRRLPFKVGAFLVFLIVLPLSIALWYSFDRYDLLARELTYRQNLLFAQQCKNEASRFLDSWQHFLFLVKEETSVTATDSSSIAGIFRRHLQRRESCEWLRFVSSDGTPRVHVGQTLSSGSAGDPAEKALLVSSQDFRFRPGGVLLKCPVTIAGEPGYLLAASSLNRVQENLSRVNLGSGLRFFLVDLDGNWILGQGNFQPAMVRHLLARPFGSFDIAETGGNSQEFAAVTLPVPTLGLRAVVLRDTVPETGVRSRRKIQGWMLWGIFCVVLVLLGIKLSLNLTSAVGSVSRTAQQIAEGNMKAKVPTDRDDEIGQLAVNFNLMASRLRKQVFELSSSFKVSEIINRAPSHQSAMDQSLAYIVTIFLARRGSIMLLGDDGEVLRLKSVKNFGDIEDGPPEPVQEKIILKPGEGIAGIVFQTGKPVFIENCGDDPRFVPYPEGCDVAPPGSLLSVPLIVQGKVFGVLNLADRSDHRYFRHMADDDLELITTVVNQTAVSIDNARLQELAITDGLTKLFIHRYFQIKLDEEVNRSHRYGDLFSLLLFDIDHFKKFNDTWGHQTGDGVLRETGRLLSQSLRMTDLGFRYGGEEFAIILPKTTADQALIFAERLRKRFASHQFQGPEGPLAATISLGIAEFPGMARNKIDLIRHTDVALYASKSRGRNQTTIFTPDLAAGKSSHDH